MPLLRRRVIPVAGSLAVALGLTFSARADSADYGFVTPEKAKATASSTLEEKGRPKSAYQAANAFDGKTETAWCEGTANEGTGSTIAAAFAAKAAHGVVLLNGFGKQRSLYLANNRIKDYKLTVTDQAGKTHLVSGTLKDNTCAYPTAGGKMSAEEICQDQGVTPDKLAECVRKHENLCIMDAYEGGGERIAFAKPLCVKALALEIVSVYAGKKHNDTCVAEVQLFEDLYPAGGTGQGLAGVCK